MSVVQTTMPNIEHTVRSVDNKTVISIWDKTRDRVMSMPALNNMHSIWRKLAEYSLGHEDALRLRISLSSTVSG